MLGLPDEVHGRLFELDVGQAQRLREQGGDVVVEHLAELLDGR
jgi:hypothetical protein